MFALKKQILTHQILTKKLIHVLLATIVVKELRIQFCAQSVLLQMTQQQNKQVSVQCASLVSSAISTASFHRAVQLARTVRLQVSSRTPVRKAHTSLHKTLAELMIACLVLVATIVTLLVLEIC